MYVSEKDEAGDPFLNIFHNKAEFKLKEEETTGSPHLTASCQQPFRARQIPQKILMTLMIRKHSLDFLFNKAPSLFFKFPYEPDKKAIV